MSKLKKYRVEFEDGSVTTILSASPKDALIYADSWYSKKAVSSELLKEKHEDQREDSETSPASDD